MSDTSAVSMRIDVPALLELAVNGNASIETLERLVALAKDIRAEQAKAAWHRAMADFQNDVPEVIKSKTARVRTKGGTEYAYQYAPLQDLISAIRPALAQHGLSVVFETSVTKDSVLARCLVGHADGHVQSCEFTIPIDLQSHMNPAQQVASACTYARRYAYMSALGLSPEDDDDGAAAGGNPPEDRFQTSTQRTVEKEQKRQESGPPVWRGKLVKVDTKNGKKQNGEPWTLYVFHGAYGEKFATFSETTAKGLQALDGHFIEIIYEEKKTGKAIVEYRDITLEESGFGGEHE